MLQRRGLKHSASSPQILSTPGFGPAGGMSFGDRPPSRAVGSSRFRESNMGDTFTISEDVDPEAPAGPQMATRGPGLIGGDSFDRPRSGEDAQSPSYPDGAILMHEPSVHLYSEPKLEEAMNFDVIINVAREVKNPFKAKLEEKERESIRHEEAPFSAASMMSFRTAFEVQPTESETTSPSTPRPKDEVKTPEYIHKPWDHNTDVKDELWDLCQTIESRVNEGKRVLVHCQQGASRSATLIIAYGMYKNPGMSVADAYTMAKSKSPWVNPNMSLLFSLNDFKKVIERKQSEKTSNIPVRSKSQKSHSHSFSADNLDSPSTASRARGLSNPSPTVRDGRAGRRVSRVDLPSNPLGAFDFGFGRNDSSGSNATELPQEWTGLMSPRLSEMTHNPIVHALTREDTLQVVKEEQEQPPLFSPCTTFDFPRMNFFPPTPTAPAGFSIDDPRSPPISGEAPIIRSIDDFL